MRWIALALVLAAGCSDKKQSQSGLPPAQEWGADPGSPAPANPHGAPSADMSGAMPSGHPNVAQSGQPGPVAPHAQMPAGHPPIDQGGTDVSKLNLPAPDPNRPIDPAHHIKGVIMIHPKAADRAK